MPFRKDADQPLKSPKNLAVCRFRSSFHARNGHFGGVSIDLPDARWSKGTGLADPVLNPAECGGQDFFPFFPKAMSEPSGG